MKNITDKEIQELLEKGALTGNGNNEDEKTYRLLFETLKKEPVESLPYNFSAKVTAQVRLQQDLKLGFKPYLVIVLSLIAVFVTLYFASTTVQTRYIAGYLSSVFEYKWIILFTMLCFTIIKYFDQRLQYAKILN